MNTQVPPEVNPRGQSLDGPATDLDPTTRIYQVPDISCDHCKRAIEDAVSRVASVSAVEVTVAARIVLVEGPADDGAIRAAIEDAGYDIAGEGR